jgi:hypothetical protein
MTEPLSTYKIEYLRGANFVTIELNRGQVNTLDELRSHMEIPSRAVITVRNTGEGQQGVEKPGNYSLQEGDYVAAVETDKTGGIILLYNW